MSVAGGVGMGRENHTHRLRVGGVGEGEPYSLTAGGGTVLIMGGGGDNHTHKLRGGGAEP